MALLHLSVGPHPLVLSRAETNTILPRIIIGFRVNEGELSLERDGSFLGARACI